MCLPASTAPSRRSSVGWRRGSRRAVRASRGGGAITPLPTRSTAMETSWSPAGDQLENGFLVLATSGRIAVRWSRPVVGTIKTVTLVREVAGWYVCCSGAEVPIQPLPPTGRETGRDGGLKVFLLTADGDVVENPRHSRRAENRLAQA